MASDIRWRIGLIANPESGKDVRRLSTEAQVVSTADKLAMLRKFLVGLSAGHGLALLGAADEQDLPGRAWQTLSSARRPELTYTPVSYPLGHGPADTVTGTRALCQAGADVLVSLGGDGTHRLVAEAAGARPLVPISTGTNNAFGIAIDPTLIGLALSRALAHGPLGAPALFRPSRLMVRGPFGASLALVDVAVLPWQRRGKAVWDPRLLSSVFLTRGEPGALGLSSVLGQSEPLAPQAASGRVVVIDPRATRRVWCPLGPGLVAEIGISEIRPLTVGQPETIFGPATLALDGEPQLTLADGEEAWLELEPGPWVFDPTSWLWSGLRPSAASVGSSDLRQALEESLLAVIGRLSAEAAGDSLYGDQIPAASSDELWQRPISFDPRFDLGPDPAVIDELSRAITRSGHPLNLRACLAASGLVDQLEAAETVAEFRDIVLEAVAEL
ncbi:MAG: NAD(+)/NADH kinase [Sulfobacillus sp.]